MGVCCWHQPPSDMNSTHPSKFNPQYNMIQRALVNNCHNYAYDKQIPAWIQGNHSLRCQVNTQIWN